MNFWTLWVPDQAPTTDGECDGLSESKHKGDGHPVQAPPTIHEPSELGTDRTRVWCAVEAGVLDRAEGMSYHSLSDMANHTA